MVALGLTASLVALGRPAGSEFQAVQDHALEQYGYRERDLPPRASHTYSVYLHRGDFLHAVVTPRGIDVAVAFVGPNGGELLATDTSSDQVTPEAILAIADVEGRHDITVRAAVAGVPAGRYAIRIEALRPATDVDAVRVRAMRDLEGGIRLRLTLQPKAMEQAIAPLEAARAGFREAADRHNETRAAYEVASNLQNLAKPEGLEGARHVLAAYRELGDEVGTAKIMHVIGAFHERASNVPEALAALSESLTLSRKIGDASLEALTLNTLGIVYGRTGDLQRAAETFQQAVRLSRRMQLPRSQLLALNNLGIVTKDLGEFRRSLGYYQDTLALARARDDRNMEAIALNNVGNLHRILGEYEEALVAHERALTLARQTASADSEARALNTLGSTRYRLGTFRAALDYHDQALVIRRRLNDVVGQAASLDGAGLARHRLGDSSQAIELLTEALRIRRAVGERLNESNTLFHLAQVERDRGGLTAALGYIESAVQLTNRLRGQVANPDLRASFVAAEQERYEVYIDVLMQLHREQADAGFDRRALEASEGGRARVLLESLLEARADIRRGIDPTLLERERVGRRQLDEAAARLSRLLTRQSEAKEIDRARAALETLTSQHQELQERIGQESPAYAALTQPRPLSTSEMQHGLIDADTIVLEYALGEMRSWLWTVTADRIASVELPPRRDVERVARRVYELVTARQPRPHETTAARSARVTRADAEWSAASTELARMIVGPAAAHLADGWRGKRIAIVAADVLQYVPFSALPDPATGKPLAFDHEVVVLPSVSVLGVIRHQAEGRTPPQRTLAVLADPVFERHDPRVAAAVKGTQGPSAGRLSRLPFSREEARGISALVPVAQRLEATDFRASRAMATSAELAQYRFVHFATHGVFDAEQPERSGLVFSRVDRHGTPQDGLLRLTDVYNLRLPADVVVLSACQTALGKEIRGEGLVGLTRGFMYAGAQRVVASLWEVDDLATAELMRLFYTGILKEGLRPAAALRTAQQALARHPRWAAPFFWSAFELQGDWR